MNRNNRLGTAIPIPANISEDHKKRLLKRARYDLMDELLDRMQNEHWYAIRITEKWPHPAEVDMAQYDPLGTVNYYMYLDVNEVRTERVIIPQTDYEDYSWTKLTRTALGEVKRRIRSKLPW